MDQLIEIRIFAVPGGRNLKSLDEFERPLMLADQPICIGSHDFPRQRALQLRKFLRRRDAQNRKKESGFVLADRAGCHIGRKYHDGHMARHITGVVGEDLRRHRCGENLLIDDIEIFVAWGGRVREDTTGCA